MAEQAEKKGQTLLSELEEVAPNLYLWQGDIMTLKVDAIVNAANNQVLGCFIPHHRCIDNAIHSQAGLQLRLECYQLMKEQGYLEPTGQDKLTRAYNLPAKYVLHTVDPIVQGELRKNDEELLVSSYQSCLKLAFENRIEGVAFCCIRTDEFHFPNQRAAELAVKTVRDFMIGHPQIKIVFNVFKDKDLKIYKDIISKSK
ncbi:protein-ADP-ribose hydrolase [Streptococcus sp. Marseille-Q5986]|uniref:protein-ADP-ribose hydrolase n=1 Tax=Streptococcus sp. Marseille-Q5986 TaxID=2972782 RepID=UPI002B26DC6B|nr:protein-ADP-ribose hydrolase [Streptococcus sp. Marseille-Q5986]